MSRFRLPFWGIALAACAGPADPGVTAAAIADGVEITDTPEVVAIRRVTAMGESLCSGTVIGPYHVLTARHCVADGERYEMVSGPSAFEVLVASRLDDERAIRARHRVARVHPYGGEREEFAYEGRDVAVLVTQTRLAPEARSIADADPAEGDTLTIVGFGRNGEAASFSSGIKRRGETLVDTVVAFDPSSFAPYSGIVVGAGGANGVCAGDSGGPAFDASGAIVGVTSLGATYCRGGGGGVFMSTHASRAFIEDALRLYPGCLRDDPRDGCTATPVVAHGEIPSDGISGLGADLALGADGRVFAGAWDGLYALEESGTTWTATSIWSTFDRPVVATADGRVAAGADTDVAIWEPGSFTPDVEIPLAGPDVRAIAMAADLVVVGMPFTTAGVGGAVHVLRRGASGWALETTITSTEESFGTAVATDGVRIAIGAPLADGTWDGEGAVLLYAEGAAGWAEEARLVASDPGAHDHFGAAVAMRTGVLAIGAPGQDRAGGDAGAVYVFGLGATGATEIEQLAPDDGSGLHGDHGNRLGTDVELAADGSRLVAGAPGDRRAGAIWVFGARPGGGFGLVERIGPRGGELGQRFGDRVALDGDRVIAAAPARTDATSGSFGVVSTFSVGGACETPRSEPTPCEPPIEPDAGVPTLDAGRPDAGRPPARDAFVTPDAGPEPPPPAASGCGCTVPSRANASGPGLLALVALGGAQLARARSRRGAAR